MPSLARPRNLAALCFAADRHFLQRRNRRSIQHCAIDAELRAVTRTIPAALERIPVQMTAKVRAGRRIGVHRALLITIGGNFFQAVTHDRTLAGLDLTERADLSGRNILGEILDRRRILANERAERADGLALRPVQLLPKVLALHDHAGDDQASDDAMGHALAGVAGMHVDVLVTRVTPTEGRIVDRI